MFRMRSNPRVSVAVTYSTIKALQTGNIHTVSDLLQRSPESILAYHGIGKTTVEDLLHMLPAVIFNIRAAMVSLLSDAMFKDRSLFKKFDVIRNVSVTGLMEGHADDRVDNLIIANRVYNSDVDTERNPHSAYVHSGANENIVNDSDIDYNAFFDSLVSDLLSLFTDDEVASILYPDGNRFNFGGATGVSGTGHMKGCRKGLGRVREKREQEPKTGIGHPQVENEPYLSRRERKKTPYYKLYRINIDTGFETDPYAVNDKSKEARISGERPEYFSHITIPITFSTRITDCGFPRRIEYALRRGHVETVSELLALSREQVMKIRNIGEVGADEIERWIEGYRRSLRK